MQFNKQLFYFRRLWYIFYMWKCVLICISAVSPVFFACSNIGSPVESGGKDKTLMTLMSERRIDWENELEPFALKRNTEKLGGMESDVDLIPQTYALSALKRGDPVYPFIEGFGSLDTSSLTQDAKAVLDGFCNAFLDGNSAESYIDAEKKYALVFFLSDIKLFFKAEKNIFNGRIYGTPFIKDETFGVPVRFTGKDVLLDVFIYLNRNSDWKINQIQIKNIRTAENAE